MENYMNKVAQFLIGLLSTGSLIIFFVINIRLGQQDFENRHRFLFKSVIGTLAFGFACAGMSLVDGVISIEMTFVLGSLGFLVGVLSFGIRWINYEIYLKRFNPYIFQKSQNVVANLSQETGPPTESSVSQAPFKLKKLHKRIIIIILNIFFGAVCFAFAAVISGGGIDGFLLGLLIGSILGLVIWAVCSMLGLYNQFYEH